LETKHLEISNKINLAYYSEHVPDSKVGIILVHGLAEHKGRYDDFIQQLNGSGMSVFAVDLRGHGESAGRRGDIKTFSDYLDDLHFFVSHIKEKYPELKLVLFGHSLGGLISSSYVSTYEGIDLLILSSPFINVHRKTKLFKFIPHKLGGFIKLRKTHSESKSMLEYSRKDELACSHFTLRLAGVMIKEGVSYITERFKDIKIPLLMMGGALDPVVDSGQFELALEKFGSENKTLKVYEDKKHRLVQNERKDEIIQDIIEWIKENQN